MFRVFLLSIFVMSCGQDICYLNGYMNVTNYPFELNEETPDGIQVDNWLFDIDLVEIDNTFTQVENCLSDLIERDYVPVSEAGCLDRYIRPTPIKTCIKIKMVEPVFSECSEWHFLKEEAPQALCDDKGLEESAKCPCRWR